MKSFTGSKVVFIVRETHTNLPAWLNLDELQAYECSVFEFPSKILN